jgi:hypothetical protein
LTQLQELHFGGFMGMGIPRTNVGDAGLQHLKGLTRLQLLEIGGTNVTDAGVKDLQKALPKAYITR